MTFLCLAYKFRTEKIEKLNVAVITSLPSFRPEWRNLPEYHHTNCAVATVLCEEIGYAELRFAPVPRLRSALTAALGIAAGKSIGGTRKQIKRKNIQNFSTYKILFLQRVHFKLSLSE
jgi:hypothetical protein